MAQRRNGVDGADLDVAEVGQVIEIMTDFYAQPRKNGAETSYVSETYHTATKEKPRNHKMKRKIEVSIRQLTREDRERFITAKTRRNGRRGWTRRRSRS